MMQITSNTPEVSICSCWNNSEKICCLLWWPQLVRDKLPLIPTRFTYFAPLEAIFRIFDGWVKLLNIPSQFCLLSPIEKKIQFQCELSWKLFRSICNAISRFGTDKIRVYLIIYSLYWSVHFYGAIHFEYFGEREFLECFGTARLSIIRMLQDIFLSIGSELYDRPQSGKRQDLRRAAAIKCKSRNGQATFQWIRKRRERERETEQADVRG